MRTRTVCHTPINYNIVTSRQAGREAWLPATISWCRGISHDIMIKYIHQRSYDTAFLSVMQQRPYRESLSSLKRWTHGCLPADYSWTLWLGSEQQINQVDVSDILILSSSVKVVGSARYLGVIINSQLSLSSHSAALCRSGFYHLRQLRPLCRSLPAEATETLVQTFISCRLDYCNSLLYGVTNKLMR